MNKAIIITLTVAASFLCGFAFKTALVRKEGTADVRRATGIGGIFLNAETPKK